MGEFETADALGDGAGEGAAFVAEEFAFEQAGGDGGAIHFDKGVVVARAEIVNGAGDEFLAGAGFAVNENGGIGGTDGFEFFQNFLERGAFADDLVEHGGLVDFLAEGDVLLEELFFESVDFDESVFEGFAREVLLGDVHVGADEFGDGAVWFADGMAEDVKVANGTVVKNDAVVQFEIAGIGDGPLNRFLNGGTLVGMNATENRVQGDLAVGFEAEDAVAFLAEVDFARGDAAGPTAGVAEALAFGKVSFTATESFLGTFALGDVAIDAVDFRSISFHLNGSGDEGDVEAGAVFAFAREFGVDPLAAAEGFAKLFRGFLVAFGNDQVADVAAEGFHGSKAVEVGEFAINAQDAIVDIAKDDGFGSEFEEFFEMRFLLAEFFLGALALGDVHGGADEGSELAGVDDGAADAGDIFEGAVGENETEFVLEFALFADRLVDVLFKPVAVVGVNSAPEERRAGLIFLGIGAEDQEMLARPLEFAVGKVPDPTAGMAELLAFLEKEFAGALLVVAESVVDGESNLIGDEGEVADFVGRIGICAAGAEAEAAETAISGGQGKDAREFQIGLFVQPHHAREAGFGLAGRNDDRLLVIVDPPGDGFFCGKIFGDDEFGAFDGFEESGADFIFISVVEKDGHEIESDYLAEFPGEDAEEFFWVAMDADGLGDAEESFKTRGEGLLETGLLSCGHAFVYLEEFQEGQPLCLAAISTLANLPRGQQDFRAQCAARASASSARGQNAYLMPEEGESIRLGIGGDSSGGR
jgi:hypothetical protein